MLYGERNQSSYKSRISSLIQQWVPSATHRPWFNYIGASFILLYFILFAMVNTHTHTHTLHKSHTISATAKDWSLIVSVEERWLPHHWGYQWISNASIILDPITLFLLKDQMHTWCLLCEMAIPLIEWAISIIKKYVKEPKSSISNTSDRHPLFSDIYFKQSPVMKMSTYRVTANISSSLLTSNVFISMPLIDKL